MNDADSHIVLARDHSRGAPRAVAAARDGCFPAGRRACVPLGGDRETVDLSTRTVLRDTRHRLEADALSLVLRLEADQLLVVCTADGRVRQAVGSISLGTVARGAKRLSGVIGLLQAMECCSLMGFQPWGYLGAPFLQRGAKADGGVAAWTRRNRRWTLAEARLLRATAASCREYMLALEFAGPFRERTPASS